MENKILTLLLALSLTLTLPVSQALPETLRDHLTNNSFLIDGKQVNMDQLSTISRGLLSIEINNTESGKTDRIPFLIYLKRAGKIVDADAYAHNNLVESIEISEVLQAAQPGDELVIDAVNKDVTTMRRVVVIKSSRPVPQFQWFYTGIKKDKC